MKGLKDNTSDTIYFTVIVEKEAIWDSAGAHRLNARQTARSPSISMTLKQMYEEITLINAYYGIHTRTRSIKQIHTYKSYKKKNHQQRLKTS